MPETEPFRKLFRRRTGWRFTRNGKLIVGSHNRRAFRIHLCQAHLRLDGMRRSTRISGAMRYEIKSTERCRFDMCR